MKPYFITMEIVVTRSIRTLEDAKRFIADHGAIEASFIFRPANTNNLIESTFRGPLTQVLEYLAQEPREVHEDGPCEIEFFGNEARESITDRAEIALLIQASTVA